MAKLNLTAFVPTSHSLLSSIELPASAVNELVEIKSKQRAVTEAGIKEITFVDYVDRKKRIHEDEQLKQLWGSRTFDLKLPSQPKRKSRRKQKRSAGRKDRGVNKQTRRSERQVASNMTCDSENENDAQECDQSDASVDE